MLYDLDSGRQSILWRAPDQGKWDVRDLEFSQDGSKLVIYAATKDRGDAVWVVNVFSAKIESSYPTDGTPFIFFGAARLSPDNRRLYLSRTDLVNYRYGIQCLDLTTGREVWQTERVRDNGVTALAISPDGRMLASGSGYEDPTIHIWDAATGRIFRPLQGHTSWVSKLLFTKDGHLLISAATDQTIRIWDTATWTEKKVLRGHTDEIYGVAVSETGHLFASAGKGGDIMLWNKEGDDANDGYLRLPENLLVNQVMPLDRSQALLWADDKPPGLLNLGRGASLGLLPGLGPSTNILGFQSNWLCHWDGKNQILFEEWSGSEFTRRGAVTTLEWGKRPTSLAFNPARRLVAWAEPAASNSLFVATFATPGPPIELKSQTAGMSPVRFSDDGQYLAAVAPQWAALRLWDVDAGQSVVTLGEPIADIAFAAGGRVLVALVALYEKNEIRFYHLDHPERPPRYVLGRQQARELAVSPDGRLVAATSSGGVVRLCNALTGTWIEDLHGHMNAAFGVAFSPDGRRLISAGGASEAVKLWDVGTGQELLDLSGTGGGLRRAVWSADGDTILVGAPWQAWHAPSWQEIAAAEAKDPSSQGSRVLNKATVYERKF
jgi:WD40 repeat protein